MRDFFKNIGHSVSRAALCQVMMAVFGLAVQLPFILTEEVDGLYVARATSLPMLIGAGILTAGMYAFLCYTLLWADGHKQSAKHQPPTPKQSKLQGLGIVLTAHSLNLLLWLVFTFLRVGQVISSGLPEKADVAMRFCDAALDLLLSAFHGFGILLNPSGSSNPLFYLGCIAFAAAAGWFGYVNGCRDFRLLGLLGYQPKEDDSLRR